MAEWTPQELAELERANETQVAGRRVDGSSRTLTIVWQVVVDGILYLRSARGVDGQWYRGVARNYEGFLQWGRNEPRPVTFTLDDSRDAAIDAAYTAKYGRGPATDAITSAISNATTMRVDPR